MPDVTRFTIGVETHFIVIVRLLKFLRSNQGDRLTFLIRYTMR